MCSQVVAVVPKRVQILAFPPHNHRSLESLVNILEFPRVMMAFEVLDNRILRVNDVAKPVEALLGVRFHRH